MTGQSQQLLRKDARVPHQTFFNLPEEKRQQILQVVIDEFAENDYDNVSISRIVARWSDRQGELLPVFCGQGGPVRLCADLAGGS